MRGHAVVLVLALAVAASCAPQASPTSGALSGTVVDLSHEYSDQAIFWPTAESFRLDKVADGMTPQGYYYAANNFASAEHGGTHVDAPVHFAQGRWSVEQIPLEQLIGDAAVIDVSARSATQPDYQVTVADLMAWEKAHGSLNGTIVLIRTDYSKRWPDAARYLGTAERGEGAVPETTFPGSASGRGSVAGGQSHREGRGHRYGQHRLRTIDAVRDAPGALRAQHSGTRESREPRSAARARRHARRATDEDQRR